MRSPNYKALFLLAFVVGAVTGFFQPVLIGKPDVPLETRGFFALQIGIAFVLIAMFLRNYLRLRRKVLEKYGNPEES